MISLGSSKKTTNTSQQSQTEPWAPTIPYLSQFLQDLGAGRSTLGPSQDQLDAFATLKKNAAAGDPNAANIAQLATDQFGATSRSPILDAAYSTLQSQLGDVASGKNQDILSDPRIQAMLAQVGNDVQNRISGAFAAAGRDVTGNAAGQGAIAKGVTSAQLPILMDEYARQQARTDAAINEMFGAGATTAQTGQALDANALATRAGGITTDQAALAARDLPANTVLNLDQQLKDIPFQDLSLYASLLLPVAGLGQQAAGTGTSTTSGTSSGINLGLGDIGKLGTAGLSLLSDERAKTDIEPVGKTFDGQTIYRYRYKGDPTQAVHMGLIAQEVEDTKPEAVGRTGGGLKTVDYRAATEDAVRQAMAGY
jgi:hypothetical protein